MALVGTAIAGALGAFGDKPEVPPWRNVNLGTEQQRAITNNLTALPGAENLATRATNFNLSQIQHMLETSIPNYAGIQQSSSDAISSWLRGEIPAGVASQVQGNAAVRALEGGFGGTGMGRNLLARDLGLTSLDLQSKGLGAAESWMKTADNIFGKGVVDVSSMFVTPQQQYAATFQNRQQAWNAKWLGNQVDAMPDPFMRALGQAFINDEGQIMQLAGSVAGAATGGGGGGL